MILRWYTKTLSSLTSYKDVSGLSSTKTMKLAKKNNTP